MTRPAQGITQQELVRLLFNLKEKIYPWMRIMVRVNGIVEVTILPNPHEQRGGIVK